MIVHIPDELIPQGLSPEQVQSEVVAALLGRWGHGPPSPSATGTGFGSIHGGSANGAANERSAEETATHSVPAPNSAASAASQAGDGSTSAKDAVLARVQSRLDLADPGRQTPSDTEHRAQREALLARIRGARGWELLALLGEIPGMDTVEDPFPRQQDVPQEIHFD